MQKRVLEALKNVLFSLFCILVGRPMGGGATAPPTPPGYATGYLLSAKNAKKKLKLKKQLAFLSHFCHWWNFVWGGLPPSLCLRLCSKWRKQKRCSQIFREVSGVNCSKNSAVLEPRTKQFLRLWGQGQGLQNVSSRTSLRTPPLLRIRRYIIQRLKCIMKMLIYSWKERFYSG